MAVSGSYDWATTRNEIIEFAYKNLGVIAEDGTPTATQYTNGAFYLNGIMKLLVAEGMPLWALKKAYILPTADTNTFNVGISQTSNVVSSYTRTTLSAAAATSATALTVAAITGISANDALGVELDDGTVHWTTVNGAPSGSTVTATTGLASAASSGNNVYAYTTTNRITRPIRVVQAHRVESSSSNEVEINIVDRTVFEALPTKTTEGNPIQLYYDPQGSPGSPGIINIWPRFPDGDTYIRFTYHRPPSDFDGANDEPDIPQEWYLYLVYSLTQAMIPMSGATMDKVAKINSLSKMYREMAISSNQVETSTIFQPDLSYRDY